MPKHDESDPLQPKKTTNLGRLGSWTKRTWPFRRGEAATGRYIHTGFPYIFFTIIGVSHGYEAFSVGDRDELHGL